MFLESILSEEDVISLHPVTVKATPQHFRMQTISHPVIFDEKRFSSSDEE